MCPPEQPSRMRSGRRYPLSKMLISSFVRANAPLHLDLGPHRSVVTTGDGARVGEKWHRGRWKTASSKS